MGTVGHRGEKLEVEGRATHAPGTSVSSVSWASSVSCAPAALAPQAREEAGEVGDKVADQVADKVADASRAPATSATLAREDTREATHAPAASASQAPAAAATPAQAATSQPTHAAATSAQPVSVAEVTGPTRQAQQHEARQARQVGVDHVGVEVLGMGPEVQAEGEAAGSMPRISGHLPLAFHLYSLPPTPYSLLPTP